MIEHKKIVDEILRVIKKEDTSYDHLKRWVKTNKHSRGVLDTLCDEEKLIQEVANFKNTDLKTKSLARLQKSINRKNRILLFKRSALGATASIAAFIVVALLLNTGENGKNKVITEKPSIIAHAYGEQPTLILSNGMNVNLTYQDTIKDNNTVIASINSQELTYQSEEIQSTEQRFNTLIIPPKFNYTIQLPDGTKVILNASSKLTYPILFNGTTREIELEGEGYFEVTKNEKPFIVKTNGVEIKVYGTKFNVNGYNPNKIKTTLFSGSVGIKSPNAKNNTEHRLAINQTCEISPDNGDFTIKEFDCSKYQSWVDGYFYADGTTLDELLLSISKWYNVEFEYIDSNKKSIPLVGVFSKKLPLSKIIETIENVLQVKFIKNERGYLIH